MSPRREKAAFVALVVTGALLGFVAATRPWAVAHVPDALTRREVVADGRQAAGVVPAVALVALAGAVAVLSTRRVGQAVGGSLLVLAGAAAAAGSLAVVRTPVSALEQAVTAATGRTGVRGVGASVTLWPWLGVASGVLIALGGVLAVVRARSWRGLSARYETTTPNPPVSASEPLSDADVDPGLAWDALSRGEDPTR